MNGVIRANVVELILYTCVVFRTKQRAKGRVYYTGPNEDNVNKIIMSKKSHHTKQRATRCIRAILVPTRQTFFFKRRF